MPRIRDDLESLKPYRVPAPEARIELDSNENPWDLPAELRQEVERMLADFAFNRYPNISAARLREAVAARYGLTGENVMIGNGSNEVILDLMLAFGGPQRSVLLFEPSYTMHGVIARMSGTSVKEATRRSDFSIDTKAALAAIDRERPDIIVLCSPNNPTGNAMPRGDIEKLLSATDALLLLDEAYTEFAGETAAALVKRYRNLAVVKTLSKAFRLAALRVGYVLASPEIQDGLARVKLPYNLNGFSQAVAEIVLRQGDAVLDTVSEIVSERERVFAALKGISGLTAYPSTANFILFRTKADAEGVCDRLLERGVLVRNFSHKPGLTNCLRVTIGRPEENDAFLKALAESVKG